MRNALAKRCRSHEKRFSLNLEINTPGYVVLAHHAETAWIPSKRKGVKGVNEIQGAYHTKDPVRGSGRG